MRLNFFFFFLNFFQLLGPTKVLISIIFKTFKLLSKSRLKYQHCLIENINTIAVSNAFPNIIQSNYMYVNKIYKISFLQQKMWAIVTTEHPSSVVRPSVNFSHFNQLLWTYLKPLGQFEPSFGGMVLGWSPSKIVSGDPDFQPRWPPS